MTPSAPVDLTEFLEATFEKVDANDTIAADISEGSPMRDALGLALAVSKLIDFGGGILKLKSGHKFKFLRPCEECEVAAPMVTPGAILSKYCARCADELASQYKDLCR